MNPVALERLDLSLFQLLVTNLVDQPGLELSDEGSSRRGGAGESWAYLSDLDSRLLSLLSSGDKDDEAVNLGHPVSLSARLGNGDIVLLANLYWFGSFRPKTST